MLSLVVPLRSSVPLRDSFLEEVGLQNFPSHALQVVFVSNKKSLLQGLPKSAFHVRTAFVKHRNPRVWKDVGAREASGDLIYFLDEDSIFDNPEDLLRVYEFFLDRPEARAAVGYDLFHRMIEATGSSQPQIFSSEVLKQTGFTNLCLRRDVIESGFSLSDLIFSESPVEELKEMGVKVEKLKWLQVHHKQQLPKSVSWVLIQWEQARKGWQRLIQHPTVQVAKMRTSAIYYSPFVQSVLKQIRNASIYLGRELIRWTREAKPALKQLGFYLQKRVEQMTPVVKTELARLQVHAKDVFKKAIETSQSPRLPQRKKQIFVPHLTSSDQKLTPSDVQKESSTQPRFILRSRDDNEIN